MRRLDNAGQEGFGDITRLRGISVTLDTVTPHSIPRPVVPANYGDSMRIKSPVDPISLSANVLSLHARLAVQ